MQESLPMKHVNMSRCLIQSILAVGALVSVATGPAAAVQPQPAPSIQRLGQSGLVKSEDLHGRSVAQTGATVPNPGTPKIGPLTEIERRAQKRSEIATKQICNGCL
jgi:hypothetical protein